MKLSATGVIYRADEKENYRQRLYDYVEDKSFGPNYSELREWRYQGKKIAILDTSEAHETIHALRRGYLPQNIFVANAAVNKRSKAAWKAVFRKSIRAAGFDAPPRLFPHELLEDIVERESSESGEAFTMINYDSCGSITWAWVQAMKRLSSHVGIQCVFASTILAAREPIATLQRLTNYDVFDMREMQKPNLLEPGWFGKITGKHRVRVDLMRWASEQGRMRVSRRAGVNPLIELYTSAKAPMIHAAFVMTRNWEGW